VDRKEALDQGRWVLLWSRLGAQGSGLTQLERLQAAYAGPTRFYHTAGHINDCLDELERGRDHAERADEVEAAIWFHDAVYVPGAPDNEERSALLANTELAAGAVSREIRDRVSQLVLATRHDDEPQGPDAQLLCDIDLSILGKESRTYDDFERNIRREYAQIPEVAYRMGRAALLEKLLARSCIYLTEQFRSRYERQARRNLTRALARLGHPDAG
jgi:predicted metal-dependent HD superfamily phosphohydrolase